MTPSGVHPEFMWSSCGVHQDFTNIRYLCFSQTDGVHNGVHVESMWSGHGLFMNNFTLAESNARSPSPVLLVFWNILWTLDGLQMDSRWTPDSGEYLIIYLCWKKNVTSRIQTLEHRVMLFARTETTSPTAHKYLHMISNYVTSKVVPPNSSGATQHT